MWPMSSLRQWVPKITLAKGMVAVGLALTLLPLGVLAGPDGRRLTLGANRAYFDPPPSLAVPLDRFASSARPPAPTQLYRAPDALLPVGQAGASYTGPQATPSAADAGTMRAVADRPDAVTPDFKTEQKASTPQRRIEHVRHEPAHKVRASVQTADKAKPANDTAPSTKVAVRDHKVRIDAPYTRVAVDDGRVRVRAPFVDLDIRW